MSNLVLWRGARGRGLALAALVSSSVFVTGCSTDVQRFGYTGSLRPTTATNAAPIERVQSAALNRPVSVPASAPASGYGGREPYRPAPLSAARPAPISATASFVTVRPGDTAYSIARNNRVTMTEFAAANSLQYPYQINTGQRLSIPNGGLNGGSSVANNSALSRSPEPVRVAARGASSHSVVSGDTLFNISQRYGVGVGALANANNLDDYGSVKIGQRLLIPVDGTPSAQGGPLQPAANSQGGQRVLSARTVDRATRAGEQKVAVASPRERIEPLPAPPERAASQFRWPVRGRIVSRFGMASDGTRNDGINIAVPEGASVKASDNGVVAYVGDELKGYGNLILIRHANDWVTAYAHNSLLLVKRGDTVKRGQIIAKAGQSGTVDMPQVHFEVRRGAKAVDPMDYLDGA